MIHDLPTSATPPPTGPLMNDEGTRDGLFPKIPIFPFSHLPIEWKINVIKKIIY